MIESLRVKKLNNGKSFVISPDYALQIILNYELQDLKLVEFISLVKKIADTEAKYARYVIITVSDLEKEFKDKQKIQPYLYELILLGGIINKGKDTCLIKNGENLEPGYLFDKTIIDKLLINAINKIKSDGKIPEHINYLKSVVAHQDIHKLELAEMPYRVFLNSTYYQVIKEIVFYDWGYECAVCTSKKNIQVHHRTYVNRGNEHLNMRDLILLCAECHIKQHEK